jgi:hypothetical protein
MIEPGGARQSRAERYLDAEGTSDLNPYEYNKQGLGKQGLGTKLQAIIGAPLSLRPLFLCETKDVSTSYTWQGMAG